MVLYINCCPREESRTDRLARALLGKLGEYEELPLYETDIGPLGPESLAYRTALVAKRDFRDPIFDYAKQFASADTVVIAAPFWDLSFPAKLKAYLENIYVIGLVSAYDDSGMPAGLCRAGKMYYVTTAGGPFDGRFGYEYLRALTHDCFGIRESELIMAEMLDVVGNDPEQILRDAYAAYGLLPEES